MSDLSYEALPYRAKRHVWAFAAYEPCYLITPDNRLLDVQFHDLIVTDTGGRISTMPQSAFWQTFELCCQL